MPSTRTDRWEAAQNHLLQAHPLRQGRIERVGPCLLKPRPGRERFSTLVRAIIGQQISTRAVRDVIDARLREAAGSPHDPSRLLDAGLETLRAAGLSGVKASYVLNLSEAVASGRLPLARIGRLPDEEIIARLTEIKGIGRWTAEMFLIFALCRPDVLPVADLGIRVGLRDHFGLGDLPNPRECHELTESWRPYRSVAMWYLWKDVDFPKPARTE